MEVFANIKVTINFALPFETLEQFREEGAYRF